MATVSLPSPIAITPERSDSVDTLAMGLTRLHCRIIFAFVDVLTIVSATARKSLIADTIPRVVGVDLQTQTFSHSSTKIQNVLTLHEEWSTQTIGS